MPLSPRQQKVVDRGIARFWVNTNKDGPVHPVLKTNCWLWTGYVFADGYGGIMVNYHFYRAPRLSWKLATGEDPGEMCVLHKCDTPLCVNPDHLFLGTKLDNKRDCVDKMRHSYGEEHHSAKLSEDDVRTIRRVFKKGCRKNGRNALARRYNVSRPTITYAVEEGWKHVK